MVAVGPALSPVRAEGAPLRSGTILSGTGLDFGGGEPWENPATERSGCQYAMDCLAWLHSGCNPALAGHDPALTASIVDVGDLADGRTRRSLHVSIPPFPRWPLWPGAVLQLWRQDCTEIHDPSIGADSTCEWNDCQFLIPTRARWMTVSGLATTEQLSWTLA